MGTDPGHPWVHSCSALICECMVPTPPPPLSPPAHHHPTSPHHPRGARGPARGSVHIRCSSSNQQTAPAVAQWQRQQETAAAGAGGGSRNWWQQERGAMAPSPAFFFILKVIFTCTYNILIIINCGYQRYHGFLYSTTQMTGHDRYYPSQVMVSAGTGAGCGEKPDLRV